MCNQLILHIVGIDIKMNRWSQSFYILKITCKSCENLSHKNSFQNKAENYHTTNSKEMHPS